MEITEERRITANGTEQLILQIDRSLGAMAGRGEGQLVRAIQKNFGLNVGPVSK